jgi:hypothetical protein
LDFNRRPVTPYSSRKSTGVSKWIEWNWKPDTDVQEFDVGGEELKDAGEYKQGLAWHRDDA